MNNSESRRKVLVTGISGGLGRLLSRRLHRMAEVHGVDMRPFPGCPKDVSVHHLDPRKKRCEDLFRHHGFDAVVHLGVEQDLRHGKDRYNANVVGTLRILEYCQRYRVPKVVVLSTSLIYGPHPNNSAFLSEDAPLLAAQRFPAVADLVELDMQAQSFFWKHAEIETVILRPVHILGRNASGTLGRWLSQPRVVTLMGFDPMVQIVHEDDVVDALLLAMESGARGIFNITGPSATPLSTLIRELGLSTFPLPHPLASAMLKKLWDWRLSDLPVPVLDHARFVCTVDGSRATRLLGFKPHHSLRETLRSLRGE